MMELIRNHPKELDLENGQGWRNLEKYGTEKVKAEVELRKRSTRARSGSDQDQESLSL